jgi:hypothetical protein
MSQRSAIAATVARRPESAAARGDLAIIAAGTALSLSWAAILLWGAGTDSDGTELALRMTARASFVWFMLAFVAAPLHQLRPSRVTTWLLRHRRALGETFERSMAIHVGFRILLFVLHAPDRPPMVTDADFFIGIPGLLLVAALTVTSLDALKERLGPSPGGVSTTGIWVVWAIFFLCLVDSVGRKTTNHPFLAYYAFIAVLLGGVAIQVAAAHRSARFSAPPLAPMRRGGGLNRRYARPRCASTCAHRGARSGTIGSASGR